MLIQGAVGRGGQKSAFFRGLCGDSETVTRVPHAEPTTLERGSGHFRAGRQRVGAPLSSNGARAGSPSSAAAPPAARFCQSEPRVLRVRLPELQPREAGREGAAAGRAGGGRKPGKLSEGRGVESPEVAVVNAVSRGFVPFQPTFAIRSPSPGPRLSPVQTGFALI